MTEIESKAWYILVKRNNISDEELENEESVKKLMNSLEFRSICIGLERDKVTKAFADCIHDWWR